ncbi:MAG: hypothetical protein ACRDTT_33920 [Pseudonocardiaceae bacterium]
MRKSPTLAASTSAQARGATLDADLVDELTAQGGGLSGRVK